MRTPSLLARPPATGTVTWAVPPADSSSPQSSAGAPMAQRAPLAARQRRRLPPPAVARGRVADRVDAAVDPVQAARPRTRRPMLAAVKPGGDELREGDHAVLPGSDLSHASVRIDELFVAYR